MANIEKFHSTELVSVELLGDLRKIIDSARSHVAATANYELTAMYWHIGDRINRDILNYGCAEYGKQIVAQVARQLQEEYGTKGFEERTIRRMMQFAQQFPDFQIVSTLLSKLSWSHFLIVTPIKDELQRIQRGSSASVAKVLSRCKRIIHRTMSDARSLQKNRELLFKSSKK